MFKYSLDSFREDCKKLAERVKEYDFTHILVVERGGTYVAQELIKYVKRCLVVPIRVSFYNGQEKRLEPIVEYKAGVVFKPKDRVLIVDNLCDSGSTIKFLKDHHILSKARSVKTAVLINKETSCVAPDYYVRDDITDWIQFHYEDAQGNHIL